MGLLEASFPSKVDNVIHGYSYYIIFLGRNVYFIVYLPAGLYTDFNTIVSALEAAQREAARIHPDQSLYVDFGYMQRRNRFTAKFQSRVTGVRFSPDLARMLGFDSNKTYDDSSMQVTAERPPDLSDSLSLIYIYCDLLEHVFIGDTRAPLLRISSRTSEERSNIAHVVYNPVQYVPLQKKCFDTVTISMMMDTGRPIPFLPGKSIVVLEFRRSAHPYLLI